MFVCPRKFVCCFWCKKHQNSSGESMNFSVETFYFFFMNGSVGETTWMSKGSHISKNWNSLSLSFIVDRKRSMDQHHKKSFILQMTSTTNSWRQSILHLFHLLQSCCRNLFLLQLSTSFRVYGSNNICALDQWREKWEVKASGDTELCCSPITL